MRKILVRTTISTLLVLISSASVFAEEFDNQFRILLHGQKTVSGNWGLAGWGIIPDTTAPKPRGFILGGGLYKNEDRWVEIMGGVFIDRQGEEPFFDLRYLEKRVVEPFEGFLEVSYSPELEKMAVLPNVVMPLPIHLFDSPIKIGGEADIVLIKGKVSRGVGPRVAFSLPVRGLSVAIGYQFKDVGPDVFRTYIVWNF